MWRVRPLSGRIMKETFGLEEAVGAYAASRGASWSSIVCSVEFVLGGAYSTSDGSLLVDMMRSGFVPSFQHAMENGWDWKGLIVGKYRKQCCPAVKSHVVDGKT